MFSNSLSFLSSRSVSDQVSHPYKTTGNRLPRIIENYIPRKRRNQERPLKRLSDVCDQNGPTSGPSPRTATW